MPPYHLKYYLLPSLRYPNLGKNLMHVNFFCLITLLNVDVKIHAILLENRLARFLPSLVQKDQVGFVLGHQAPDATKQMINLIHLTEKSGKAFLLPALDAEKALDRIHWGYRSKVPDKFGFCDYIHSAT